MSCSRLITGGESVAANDRNSDVLSIEEKGKCSFRHEGHDQLFDGLIV